MPNIGLNKLSRHPDQDNLTNLNDSKTADNSSLTGRNNGSIIKDDRKSNGGSIIKDDNDTRSIVKTLQNIFGSKDSVKKPRKPASHFIMKRYEDKRRYH